MSFEIVVALVSAIVSLLGGAAAIKGLQEGLLRRLGLQPQKPEVSYGDKMAELTSSLTKASAEMDSVLAEVAQVTKEREAAMQKVEADLAALQSREQELQERINQLKDVPLPVAEYFAELTASGEKRSAKRDYILFGSGVLVSTIIAIVLFLVGLG